MKVPRSWKAALRPLNNLPRSPSPAWMLATSSYEARSRQGIAAELRTTGALKASCTNACGDELFAMPPGVLSPNHEDADPSLGSCALKNSLHKFPCWERHLADAAERRAILGRIARHMEAPLAYVLKTRPFHATGLQAACPLTGQGATRPSRTEAAPDALCLLAGPGSATGPLLYRDTAHSTNRK